MVGSVELVLLSLYCWLFGIAVGFDNVGFGLFSWLVCCLFGAVVLYWFFKVFNLTFWFMGWMFMDTDFVCLYIGWFPVLGYMFCFGLFALYNSVVSFLWFGDAGGLLWFGGFAYCLLVVSWLCLRVGLVVILLWFVCALLLVSVYWLLLALFYCLGFAYYVGLIFDFWLFVVFRCLLLGC